MELLSFTIAAGETKRFERAGRLLEIIDASAALNIELTGPNGEQADDMRGALSGFYSLAPFNGFEVSNPQTYAQAVVLMIADGNGGSRRQPGNVRVIDNSSDKTLAGQQFVGSITCSPPVGKIAVAGIKAISKRVAARRIVLSSTLAGSVSLIGLSGDPTTDALVQGVFANNKLSSGAQSTTFHVRASDNVMPGAKALGSVYIAANVPYEFPISSPVVVEVGYLLVASAGVIDRNIILLCDFEELP